MRFHSYVNSAIEILKQYKGQEPFAPFLKKFFGRHKKYGSKDRKQISHLCYCYFRLGKSLPQVSIEERILIGLFLCSTEPNEILAELKPEWKEKVNLPADKKLLIIPAQLRQSGGNYPLLIKEVFPWKEHLSEGIDYEKFCESFFVQPDLFLRLRPGYENVVKEKLLSAEINFIIINSSCLSLPNASKVEKVIELDREAVVQDYSSQRIREYFELVIANCRLPITAWDCCAASGGKSLLLLDINPNIELTVSDVRESILINLQKRFAKAGIEKYRSFVADLAAIHSSLTIHHSQFDLIICDAPCTGSGTWSRTPEQLYFFDENKIEHYAQLQRKIVLNVIPYLKENGFLVYITCSVFKNENEDVVRFITEELNLELIKRELFNGYDKKADTMFAALFRKS